MLSRKICMIGDFSVGKTSLVARFVHASFSDAYLTTVGVKVDTKVVTLEADKAVKMVLWDIASTDALKAVDKAYLMGAKGFLLVVDGTRAGTLDTAWALSRQVREVLGDVPYVVLANKADLAVDWEVDADGLAGLAGPQGEVFTTSAKTGQGVEAAFTRLARMITGG